MIYQILLVLFLESLFLLTKKKRKHEKLPPGPVKIPIIGNLHQLGKLPHRSLQHLSKTYGDLMFLQLGFVPTLVVSSPDMALEIFKNHDLVFSGRPPIKAFKKIAYNFSSMSTAPYGDYWRQVRKIVVLELLTAKRVESFGRIRAEEVGKMIKRISCTIPGPVDLSSMVFSLSNNVVCRVAFGTMGDPVNSNKFLEVVGQIQLALMEFNVGDYFPGMDWINRFNGVDKRIRKNMQELDRFFDKAIEEHRGRRFRSDSDIEDIIDVLLRAQKDPQEAISLTDEHLKALLMEIFIGGSDTTSATIIWTMAELIRNPSVKQKAQKEVRSLFQLGKCKIEEVDLPKLTYLKLVIKESLRLHPPAPLLVPRETTERCTIGNQYEIPAKTRVFINAAAIATDPEYWENPEIFWPDRFANSAVDYKGQHFELLPFGAGRRGCPGISFAIPVVELVLANLLFCFDWELPQGMSIKDVDMEEALGITVNKKTPLLLVALPMK